MVRVNEVMRGVVVSAGVHDVVWTSKVPGLRAGVLVTLLAALTMAGLAARMLLRRRRGE